MRFLIGVDGLVDTFGGWIGCVATGCLVANYNSLEHLLYFVPLEVIL